MPKQEQVIRILLVEDSMDIAEQLVSMLRNAGIPVRPNRAVSASSVSELLAASQPDLVLVGIKNQTPTLTETIALVTATGKDIPIISVCSKIEEATFLSAFAEGASALALLSNPEQVQRVVRTAFSDLYTRRSVRRLQTNLREVERRCDALLDSSRDPIAFLHEGLHVRANKAYLDIFGYDEFEELSGLSILDMVAPKYTDEFKILLKKFGKGEKPPERLELEAQRADGGKFPALMEFVEATFEGEPCLQITFRRQEVNTAQAEELERLRHQDLVTGLYNRQYFLAELEKITAEASKGRADLSLLLVEADEFKKVLDTVGMGNADLLLSDMANLLKKELADTDIAARINEQTFAILIAGQPHDSAQSTAKQICSAFEAHVFDLNQKSVNLTASIGVVLIGEKLANLQSIMNEASNILRTAQTEGGNRYNVFDPAAQDKADAEKQQAWLNLVKEALEKDGFLLYFQPIINIMGEEGEFYEILLRLHGPKGEVNPGYFLPIAERSGLMAAIDRWVISKAIKILAEREREGRKSTFFIKITPQSMEDTGLLPWLAAQLQAARLRGDALVFGMPESKVVTNLNNVRRFQKGLEQLHCHFVIEQFGSGLNSFQLLKHIDAGYLKIDRIFMAELAKNKENQAKIREISEQARALGKNTIAEFVEDTASMSILFSCGIHFVQGNFLQEPEKVMSYDFSNT